MCEAYPHASMSDDFGQCEIRRLDIEVSFHYLQVGGYGTEEVIGDFVGEIAEAQDLGDLPWS